MTDPEFRDLVKAMRLAQRTYYKTRDPACLKIARECEHDVDVELFRWTRKEEGRCEKEDCAT